MSANVHQNLIDLAKTANGVSPSGKAIAELKTIATNTIPADAE